MSDTFVSLAYLFKQSVPGRL